MDTILNYDESVVVVCASDDNYAMPLAVTLCSAVKNFKSHRKLDIFIIDGGISDKNKSKIQNSLTSKNVNCSFLLVDSFLLTDMQLSERMTMSIYHRLLIPELLPPSYSKAIYLDSDVIVRGNLEELWDIEIGEHHLLAVQDLYINYVSSPGGLKNYKELGGVYDSKFFNAGVLVIHLDKWRADNIGSQVIEYAKKMSINDQDSLNSILLGRWGQLDPRWNQIAYIHTYKSWPENSFKHEIEPLYKDLVYNSYIIHFTSSKKPWKLGCKHPQRNLFFKYLGMTRWSNLLPFYYFRYFFEFCEHCLWKLRKIIYKKESKV